MVQAIQPFRSSLADRVLAQATTPRTGPVQSVGEGAAKAGTQLVQALLGKRLLEEQKGKQTEFDQGLAGVLARTQERQVGDDTGGTTTEPGISLGQALSNAPESVQRRFAPLAIQSNLNAQADKRSLAAALSRDQRQQAFTSGENQLSREFRSGESQLGRGFRGGESEKDRAAKLEAADLKFQRDLKVAGVKASARKSTGVQAKVDALVKSGVPAVIAQGVAGGRFKVNRNPLDQSIQIIDVSNGNIVFPKPAVDAPATGQAGGENPKTLFEMAGEDVTGIIPGARSAAQGVTGQFGINTAPPALLDMRQTFATEKNNMIRALSINPRFPVGEIKRLSEEINIAPGIFTDERTLKSRIVSVGRSLRRRVENEERAARDTSLPAETRQNAAAAAKDINNFLQILGAPEDGENLKEGQKIQLEDGSIQQVIGGKLETINQPEFPQITAPSGVQ